MNRTLLSILFIPILLHANCQGQEESRLQQLIAAIESDVYPNIQGIIVEKEGEILVEEYFDDFDEYAIHDTSSSFKSITSLLTGIAIDQGLFTVDDEIGLFFPELTNPDKQHIRVENLLTMRSGQDCEEFHGMGPDCETAMVEEHDWIAFCLDIPMKHEPGVNFSYSSIPPVMIGEIIARTSGMSVMEFAKRYLFEPLAITNYRWTVSPAGQAQTAGSFFMLPRDMLKIGQLVHQRGVWENQQIVSEAWIEASTTCNFPIDFSFLRFSDIEQGRYRSSRYGYFWYREVIGHHDLQTEVLFASGNGGQYIMLLEDYDARVVFNGGNYGNWRGKLPFEILLKYLIPIMTEE